MRIASTESAARASVCQPRRTAQTGLGISLPRRGNLLLRRGSPIPRRGMTIPCRGSPIPRRGIAIPCRGMTIPRRGIAIPRRRMTIPRPFWAFSGFLASRKGCQWYLWATPGWHGHDSCAPLGRRALGASTGGCAPPTELPTGYLQARLQRGNWEASIPRKTAKHW